MINDYNIDMFYNQWWWVLFLTLFLKLNLFIKTILYWYISDINVATHVYLQSLSTDISSSIYGAISFPKILLAVNFTIEKYRFIKLLMIDKILKKTINSIDIDLNMLNTFGTEKHHDFFVRESTKSQVAAYSETLNNNIVCILQLINIWIVFLLLSLTFGITIYNNAKIPVNKMHKIRILEKDNNQIALGTL